MASNALTTGQLAALAGINIETVRFYERRGLIAEPKRTVSNYRQYLQSDVARLHFIKRAQELGFSLKEIVELLSLRAAPARSRSRVKRLAEEKLRIIDHKIRDLQRMRKSLASTSAACDGHGMVAGCPIIHALEDGK